MGKSGDFQFWEENLPSDLQGCGSSGDWVEFEVQKHGEDGVRVCSPPFWRTAPVDFRWETSPLLPHKYNHSCLSPTSRLRAIVDGRRELTQMIKNIPESSYELSLKDIVDDQQNMEDVQEKEVILVEEKKPQHKMDNRIPRKTKYTKSSQIRRTESMESGFFLLKMFLPVSLSSKKKPKARKQPKVSPGHSSEASAKPAAKEWWKMISLAVKDKQNVANISRSKSDISSNRTSSDENTLIPCQCSFNKKSKPRRQRGCLF